MHEREHAARRTGLWRKRGIPRKGWARFDVEDAGDLSERCRMCGTDIRYVHVLTHPKREKPIRVGCVCAGHMTDDYAGAKRAESVLRKRALRLDTWIRSPRWRESRAGNLWRKYGEHRISVGNTWCVLYGQESTKRFRVRSVEEAMTVAFDALNLTGVEAYTLAAADAKP